jgi:hypothetical protein
MQMVSVLGRDRPEGLQVQCQTDKGVVNVLLDEKSWEYRVCTYQGLCTDGEKFNTCRAAVMHGKRANAGGDEVKPESIKKKIRLLDGSRFTDMVGT